jgi:4-hydroxy-3-polyprenylbenzoate decarboxylase
LPSLFFLSRRYKIMVLIIGITGSTGAIYGIRMLEVLSSMSDIETHLVISEAGETTIRYETDKNLTDVRKLARYSYDIRDVAAQISSGSFKRDGMIVVPCTIKTASAIANSYNENLLIRSADVTLKERKKLLLMVRETPLHLGHLRMMEKLTEMGAVIMPPVPTFYTRPRTIEEIVDHMVGRMLDIFNIEHSLFHRWSGCNPEGENADR